MCVRENEEEIITWGMRERGGYIERGIWREE